MVKPYKKSVHSLSTQRVWISECVYVRVCLPVCVCRVTWGQFRYFCSILLRAKNNCQLSPLFAVAWSVCVWVCLLVNYNWWFSFSSQLGPPYPAPIICAFFSFFFLSPLLYRTICLIVAMSDCFAVAAAAAVAVPLFLYPAHSHEAKRVS